MMPLRALLKPLVGLLFVSLAGVVLAAPQHALTLYDEPPKYPANFKHVEYVNPDAPKGGTFRKATFGSFDSLNPFINKGVAVEDIDLTYDTLARQTLDEPFTAYGVIAEKIEKAPDNSWVRFYLRPEAKFNDGHPIRAEDVVFTFDTLMKNGSPLFKGYYSDVESAIAENPLQVKFTFKHNKNRELPLILGQLPVLPKHWWQTRDFGKGNLEIPVGSGPYTITEIKPGRSIRYERNKNYWGKDLPINKGLYNFDAITVDYFRDNSVAFEALKAGQFDYWFEISAKNWAGAYNIPAVNDGRLIKEEIRNANPTGMQGFVFNLRRPMFQDVRVREALSLLFDFEWTNKQLFNGAYNRTSSYFDNSEMAAKAAPTEEELAILEPLRGQIPDAVFTDIFKPSTTDGSGMIREQQRRAYKLLQEAGWRVVDDKMVDAQGKPVTIEFLLAQTEFERILLPFKRNLSELGIDLQIRRVDVSQYLNRLRSRDFDMIVGSFPQSNSPGSEQREYWESQSADKPGSRNFMGLKDPAIDQLTEGLVNAESRQSLINHARALDRVLQWGFYVIPNWHIKTWRVAYSNNIAHPAVTPLYDIGLNTWWMKPGTQQNAPTNPTSESLEP